MSKGRKVVLTSSQEAEFKELYKTHSNAEIGAHFGISARTTIRLARKFGLVCTEENRANRFRRGIAESEAWWRHKNDPERKKRDGARLHEAYMRHLRNGDIEHPTTVMRREHPERWKARCAKAYENRSKAFEMDKKRVRLGLTPRHNWSMAYLEGAIRYTKEQLCKRMYAYRKGYGVPSPEDLEDRYTLFYDESTKRTPKFEANCVKAGFTFKPMPA